jgi:hypothetical protein
MYARKTETPLSGGGHTGALETGRAYLAYGRGDRQYYFLFGPLMGREAAAALGISPRLVTSAKLPGFRLRFMRHPNFLGDCEAAAVPAEGGCVWGALYELRFREALILDALMDARSDGNGPFFHFPAELTDPQGTAHHALMYRKDSASGPSIPSREYMRLFVSGAKECGLPPDYVSFLESVPVSPGGPPHALPGIPFEPAAGCGGCGRGGGGGNDGSR